MEYHHRRKGQRLSKHLFSTGPDVKTVHALAHDNYLRTCLKIHMVVVNPAPEYLQPYTFYVNVSKSDVLCTATAEALVTGRFVVYLRLLGNELFPH